MCWPSPGPGARAGSAGVRVSLSGAPSSLTGRSAPGWSIETIISRAATPKPLPTEPELEPEPPARGSALAATVLAVSGALVFAVGATVELWPVWALGLALFASGFLVYSPRP